jgi:hypothetical protein
MVTCKMGLVLEVEKRGVERGLREGLCGIKGFNKKNKK